MLPTPAPLQAQEVIAFQGREAQGVASWYSESDAGILATTANMELFDDEQLTCAIWDIPFNTLIRVTNLDNGKSIIVRVNDRGPAKRLVRKGRIIDLTKEAFSRIADLDNGLIKVKITILSPTV
jgi:rare lipoprotein A